MRAKVAKWGNSLAIRIPKHIAIEVGLKKNTPVEVSLSEGRLVVELSSEAKPTLDELLMAVTEENIHSEIDFGLPVGKEAW